jgi:hypothetical protein
MSVLKDLNDSTMTTSTRSLSLCLTEGLSANTIRCLPAAPLSMSVPKLSKRGRLSLVSVIMARSYLLVKRLGWDARNGNSMNAVIHKFYLQLRHFAKRLAFQFTELPLPWWWGTRVECLMLFLNLLLCAHNPLAIELAAAISGWLLRIIIYSSCFVSLPSRIALAIIYYQEAFLILGDVSRLNQVYRDVLYFHDRLSERKLLKLLLGVDDTHWVFIELAFYNNILYKHISIIKIS